MPDFRPRTLLGFDYGKRRIGAAIGQELTLSARPLTIINNRGVAIWPVIHALIIEWRPAALIVGIPHHRDGTANAVTLAVNDFCAQLLERERLPVHTIDERLSSKEAAERLGSGRKSGDALDAAAAAVILETWMHSQQQPI